MLKNRKHYTNNTDASFISNKKYGVVFSVSEALRLGQISVSTGKIIPEIPQIDIVTLTGDAMITINSETIIAI